MKVGDYVRLKNGYIDKIEELKLQTKYTKYNKLLFEHKIVECLFSDEDLKQLKSSPNIMDLIEVGDYVNGLKVIDIVENDIYISDYYAESYIGLVKVKNIKSIVTKEQFESMQYNLESEVN